MVLGISHPLGIVILFVVVRMLYSLKIYFMLGTFWYRIILILVMIRGIMVVFSYIARIVPNEKFKMNFWILVILFMSLFFIKDEVENEEGSLGSLKL